MAVEKDVLSRILSGQEEAARILIQDSFEVNGLHVLKWSLSQMVTCCDRIHVVLTDALPGNQWLMGGVSSEMKNKISLHKVNIFNDQQPHSLEDMFVFDSQPNTSTDEQSATILVIDNLSTLLLVYSCAEVCRVIHSLSTRNLKVISLLHYDLHDDGVINALNHIMTTVIRLSLPVTKKGAMAAATGTALSSIVHKRKSGMIIKKDELYRLSESYELHIIQEKELDSQDNGQDSPPVDPGANLTFDLSLTEQQKESRSQVVLPYTKKIKSGNIIYEPDENDDLDDSDPDDDLNI